MRLLLPAAEATSVTDPPLAAAAAAAADAADALQPQSNRKIQQTRLRLLLRLL